jgi:glyoxylase-like metal-dependent hydrolase (beta-lactamase superfamily II)
VQRHFVDVLRSTAKRHRWLSLTVCSPTANASRLGALGFEIVATPGHRRRHALQSAMRLRRRHAVCPNGGTGRCDFPGADATQYRLIKRLYGLPDETRVFLSHDYPAAGVQPIARNHVGAEKAGNTQPRAETSEADTSRSATSATQRRRRRGFVSFFTSEYLRRAAAQADAADRTFLRLPVQVCD